MPFSAYVSIHGFLIPSWLHLCFYILFIMHLTCFTFLIYIFFFKVGLGAGTNNFAELCALKLLLTLARKNYIAKIQIYGDSQLVINWANGKFRMHNIELSQVLQEVQRLSDSFELMELKHIHCERNSLSKGWSDGPGRILAYQRVLRGCQL